LPEVFPIHGINLRNSSKKTKGSNKKSIFKTQPSQTGTDKVNDEIKPIVHGFWFVKLNL
jgi:hypothetical protein